MVTMTKQRNPKVNTARVSRGEIEEEDSRLLETITSENHIDTTESGSKMTILKKQVKNGRDDE